MFNILKPAPGPAQSFLTWTGMIFLLLLWTVSAKQASLPGQFSLIYDRTIQIILVLCKMQVSWICTPLVCAFPSQVPEKDQSLTQRINDLYYYIINKTY